MAFTAAPGPSGSLSNQTDCVKIFRFRQRRSGGLLGADPAGPREGGREQTVRTEASVFVLRLLLPQNKYVLKGRVFTDITAYRAAFESGRVRNSLGSLPPRRRTRSALTMSAFLKLITAYVLVPKTFPKHEKSCWIFLSWTEKTLQSLSGPSWGAFWNHFCVLVGSPSSTTSTS